MEYNGQMVTEFSLLNEFRNAQNVSVTEVLGQKVISMKMNERCGNEYPTW